MTLRGIHVPLITPFGPDGAIAADALAELANAALDAGAAGLVALGTTAEVAALGVGERTEVIDICARICRERDASLIVGVGGSDTASTLRALEEVTPQAAAALVTVPSFTRPGEAGVRAHFAHLAEHSPVPLVIYHIPYRTGQALSAAALREIGALPGIVGVKYAAGGIDAETIGLFADLPTDFSVLVGDDLYLSPLLALGAHGGILASAHLATSSFVALHQAWQSGDITRARGIGNNLARLAAALFAEPNPTVIKGVLHATGKIPTPDVRLPLLPASHASVDAALKLLADLG
ncbi:MAG TPA: dihydrodipicolinate synthase family protein [Pseudonocardiaceae bacterium]|nr:dihydrodipicolinate synthase family protein [Pseudonocardiaceae bacterium]